MYKLLLYFLLTSIAYPFTTPESKRSPVNQVFQFKYTALKKGWSNGMTKKSENYLWIPEECKQLRGLLILCANAPEHTLVGHQAIRDVCRKNDLGIVWSVRSFYAFETKEDKLILEFFEQILDGLAEESGYEEVATVPWLPIGESGHLLMVQALLDERPNKCFAAVALKDGLVPRKNRTTPLLSIQGTAHEWSQTKKDIRKNWNGEDRGYKRTLQNKKNSPDWPVSYIVDSKSGHFEVSEELTLIIADYIDEITQLRINENGDLKSLESTSGFLADLPIPGRHEFGPVSIRESYEKRGELMWYVSEEFALKAQDVARVNWQAKTQLPGFANKEGETFPFSFGGISYMDINRLPQNKPVSTPVLKLNPDGETFDLTPIIFDTIPEDFINAGVPLSKAPGIPEFEWICGSVEYLGKGRFRMAIDRMWPSPLYIAVRHKGTDNIRSVVQPAQLSREGWPEGVKPQKITFPRIDDVQVHTKSIDLKASSSAGLPVRYFVETGPAKIIDNKIVFTKIPPKAKFPIIVTVGAWQWGRSVEPKVSRAQIVKQSFRIRKP